MVPQEVSSGRELAETRSMWKERGAVVMVVRRSANTTGDMITMVMV